MAEPRFIHLRICSEYSLSHGLAKVGDLVKRVAGLLMPAMALTDFTNLFGLVTFYDSAHAAGIKPIVGADFMMRSEVLGEQLCPLTVLAANNHGYRNLTQLITLAYLRGHVQGVPAIDRQWLVDYKQGLILLSGGQQGDVGTLLLRDRPVQVASCIAFYQQHFENHYYLEISRTGQADEKHYIQLVLPLAAGHGLPVVATHPVCFIHPEDFETHEIRVAIHDGYILNDPQRPKKQNAQYYLRSATEMCEQFADLPEALANSVEIAKRCNVTIHFGDYFMPQFPTGDMTTEAYLIQQAQAGLSQRLVQLFPEESQRAHQQPRYDQRLDRELAVINQMGFSSYFLIVMEFIQWSKQQAIPVGPGRGSGPGSLVAYALQITDLDPIMFDLLFERFLNPERVSLPDFDIDFCMDKRDLVIEHVAERYGREAVSQIITFGTMAAKAVIRDVGRVLGHPYGFVDRIAKLIPLGIGITLEKAFAMEPQLSRLYEHDEEVQALIDRARKLEGVVRNAGKHAGGVVIAPTKITDFAPLYCDPHGQHPVTQFDKSDVEAIGLVKFDFLGLRTLTIIHAALQSINARLSSTGHQPVSITTIGLTDAKSFSLLQSGQTTAIFQLESRGMKELIKRLQPDSFEEIIALVALHRPGPLQSGMVDNFIDRKHGRETVAYPDRQHQHPLLRPILEPTYGIILYQEQVMQIAQVLAGYSLGDADLLRRAMGKKDAKEMAEQRDIFEQGAKSNGIDGVLAIKIFDLMEKFAGYGFNKSHSAAYALLSYQTLWLKSHFPADFMAAVMSADLDNTDKVVSLVEECRRMGLTVLPPDINRSDYGFSVTSSEEILYGLGAIKGVGSSAVSAIVAARGTNQPFADLYALCARTDCQRLNRRSLERLIMAGALDSLQTHRAALMAGLDGALNRAEQHTKAEQHGQVDMFGLLAAATQPTQDLGLVNACVQTEVPTWTEQQRLSSERQALGLYLTGHPITQYLPELKRYIQCRLHALRPTARDQQVHTAGLVMAARIVTSKRGTKMGLLTLDDCSARLEAILYSDTLVRYRSLLEQDRLLVVVGTVSVDSFSDGLKMVVHELTEIQEMRAKHLRGLILQLSDEQVDAQFCTRLQWILAPNCVEGGAKIRVHYRQAKGQVNMCFDQSWQVNPTDDLLSALRNLIGAERVVLQFY